MANSDIIFSRAMQAGFTKEAACALLANLQAESALRPNNLEDTKNRSIGMTDEEYTMYVNNGTYTNFAGDSAGYGAAQWTWGPRKNWLLQFAREQGKSIDDLNMQMDFLFMEMKRDFPSCWNACQSSHDLNELTKKLLYEWENPAEKEKKVAERCGYAQAWWQKYANTNPEQGSARMTTEQAIQKVLDLARGEIGYHESGDNVTKYAADLDRTNWYNGPKNGFAWCDVFVDWLFYKCFGDPLGREMICQPTGSAGAGCLYSAQYYKAAGRWYTTNPQPGDQIFFTYSPGEYSHTGIVESVSGGTVVTIEGNTSDQVARRQYSLGSSNIAGYGRPKWELATGGSVTPTPAPTPDPSGGGSSSHTRILRRGMYKDSEVREMQEMLLKLGYDLGPDGADGDFGNNTSYAVQRFQRDHGLEADGEVGPMTWTALEQAMAAQETPQPQPQEPSNPSQNEPKPENPLDNTPQPTPLGLIRKGDKGVQVKLAQAALSCWGYSVSVDGIFSSEFEKKISEFQTYAGVEIDGIIGSETWRELLDLPIQ